LNEVSLLKLRKTDIKKCTTKDQSIPNQKESIETIHSSENNSVIIKLLPETMNSEGN